jgi:isochorismate pyruvate lyase
MQQGVSIQTIGGEAVPNPELRALRNEIDAIDQRLAECIAQRFEVVDRVIGVKGPLGIPAMLPDRVEEVALNARARGEALGVPPDTMERLWRLLISETIRYEEQRLSVNKG